MEQKPSIGRIVHYVLASNGEYGGEHRPATIMEVERDGSCSLHVLLGSSKDIDFLYNAAVLKSETAVLLEGVVPDEDKSEGTWHWPEREDAQ